MKIFELQFNPKNKEGRLIDTFSYHPKDVYEKRLGTLVIGGDFKKENPKDKTFLNNLAHKVKGVYHSLPTRNQEEAFKAALEKANEFLDEKNKGKMHITIASIKERELYFSSIGNLKVLLLRNNKITEIGEKDRNESAFFNSVVTGKTKKGDILLVTSKNIHTEFGNHGILKLLFESESITENQLEKISRIQKEKFPSEPGISILIDFSSKTSSEPKKIVKKKSFSFKKTFLKFVNELKQVAILILKKLKEVTISGLRALIENTIPLIKTIKIKTGEAFLFLKDKIKEITFLFNKNIEKARKKIVKKIKTKLNNVKKDYKIDDESEKRIKEKDKKTKPIKLKNKTESKKILNNLNEKKESIGRKITAFWKRIKELLPENKTPFPPKTKTGKQKLHLIALLLIIIVLGSYTAHRQKIRKMEHGTALLSEIKGSIEPTNETTFHNLKENYRKLEDLEGLDPSLKSEIEEVKTEISEILLEKSKTVIINDPKLIFEPSEITPAKIEVVNNEIMVYNPLLPDVERYNPKTNESLIMQTDLDQGGINSITAKNENPVFFSRPDKLLTRENGLRAESLEKPGENYTYNKIDSYGKNIYFLDKEKNRIIEYNREALNNPSNWLIDRKPGKIISFCTDHNSLWLLKEDNIIWQYKESGPVSDSLIEKPDIYPFDLNFNQIKTESGMPLYLLDKKNSRIILFSKEGELIKQLLFPDLENLKDFAISQNKKIYLLNNQKVYSVDIDLN